MQNRRQRDFAFQGKQQALCHLFPTLLARTGALWLADPIANLLAHGVAQAFEPLSEPFVAFERVRQLRRDGRCAFFHVRLEGNPHQRPDGGSGRSLHLLVH